MKCFLPSLGLFVLIHDHSKQTTETSTWNRTPLRTQPANLNPDWKTQIPRKRNKLESNLTPCRFFTVYWETSIFQGTLIFYFLLLCCQRHMGLCLLDTTFTPLVQGHKHKRPLCFGWWFVCDTIQANTWSSILHYDKTALYYSAESRHSQQLISVFAVCPNHANHLR